MVRGLSRVRIGAVGARPNAFNTTRFSEKLLEAAGITVNTIDLSEVFGNAAKISSDDKRVLQRIEQIRSYADASKAPDEAIVRMAKFALVVDDWMQSLCITATAMQCWSSLQKNFGVNVCTIMSMMSEQMLPSACEVDIAGVVGMYALQLASGTPSALVDWNNNYGGDPGEVRVFPLRKLGQGISARHPHCHRADSGNDAGGRKHFRCAGRADASWAGDLRTREHRRSQRQNHAYVGEGEFTEDPLETFGTRAVVRCMRCRR